jgi:pimeloyl-ACP methyl ester carboxylesterase
MAQRETQRLQEPIDARTRDVRARTGGLYTRDIGHGEAIVLIHDFPLNGRMWQEQIHALQYRYRLVAPDLSGFGLTPVLAPEISLSDHARSVLKMINALAIERVTVVGLSMGSFVALHLVQELGARLQGLLLASTRISSDPPDVARWRHELAAEIESTGVEVAADEFVPKLLGRRTQQNHPESLDFLRLMIRENTATGMAAMLRAMAARPDPSAVLRRIHCPVLCVAGEEDHLTPTREMQLLAEQIPGALTQTIPDAGHLTNVEAPEAFNDALTRLMAECTAA